MKQNKQTVLWGDGLMDFIHRSKSKILKYWKIEILCVSEAGFASILRWRKGEERGTPALLGPSSDGRDPTE
jgi:hypothetical protein